jgi:hypothetical protein
VTNLLVLPGLERKNRSWERGCQDIVALRRSTRLVEIDLPERHDADAAQPSLDQLDNEVIPDRPG